MFAVWFAVENLAWNDFPKQTVFLRLLIVAAVTWFTSQNPNTVRWKNIDVFSSVAWDYYALLELYSS